MLIIRGGEGKKRITVGKGENTRTINAENIYYIESSDHKICISLEAETIECYGKIGDLEKELAPTFYRIHKGYLVNMDMIEHHSRTDVFMKNGDMLSISKYKYADFAKAYEKHSL